MKKSLRTSLVVALIVTAGYVITLSCQSNKPKNLQVLRDKDMTVEEVKEYMRTFTLSLGVECEFCHNTDDFANDDLKQKRVTREMIKLVYALNDSYFKNSTTTISCYTCHRGQVETKNSAPGL